MTDNRLSITMNGKLVGFILVDRIEDRYHFEYAQEWIEDGFAISPHIIFATETGSGVIRRFLENLIPEGKGLEDIAEFAHISKKDTFALIRAIGYETSGALMFGEPLVHQAPLFREITDAELANRIDQIEERSIVIWDEKERLSLAGVQEKLPVIIKDAKIGLGDGSLCSTHIMKFQTKKYTNIVVNELFCMKLAKAVKLNVAEVELRRFKEHPVLMVKRFDRVYKGESVERLHVIDGCQMLDLSSSSKYERNFGSTRDVKDIRNGASFSMLFESAESCTVPAKAKMEILEWAMFNLIIGNSDAHGKNFSFFINKSGMKATPIYDLLCIVAHENVEHDLAMAYGDEFESDGVLAYQLREFSDAIGINYKLVSKTLTKFSKEVINKLNDEIIDNNILLDKERIFLEKIRVIIKKRADEFLGISSEMDSVTY